MEKKIQLVHWHPGEAAERAKWIAACGYAVDHIFEPPPLLVRRLRSQPPAAIVIDLGRLPSQGRDLAIFLRANAGTRSIPLVFVGGDPLKVEAIRAQIADAAYATWAEICAALERAIASPPEKPWKPTSTMDGYSGRPLVKKLGIKPGCRVALLDAPAGFEALVGELPANAALVHGLDPQAALLIWFVRSLAALEDEMAAMAKVTPPGGLWIAWPKKGSPLAAGFGELEVRRLGLAAGLVDYKICAVDETWSALLFTRRKV